MPKIVGELNGIEHYSWVITGYLVASTAGVPIFGKLSDIFGRKWLFLGGIATFLAGSMLAGLSASMTQLIAFRAIQGVGAGMMMPIAQAIIGDIFTPAERGKYQGLLMAVFGLSTSSARRGRLHHRQPRLALGLLRQRPHRDRRGPALVSFAMIEPLQHQAHAQARLPRHRHAARVDQILLVFALEMGGREYKWGSFEIICSQGACSSSPCS